MAQCSAQRKSVVNRLSDVRKFQETLQEDDVMMTIPPPGFSPSDLMMMAKSKSSEVFDNLSVLDKSVQSQKSVKGTAELESSTDKKGTAKLIQATLAEDDDDGTENTEMTENTDKTEHLVTSIWQHLSGLSQSLKKVAIKMMDQETSIGRNVCGLFWNMEEAVKEVCHQADRSVGSSLQTLMVAEEPVCMELFAEKKEGQLWKTPTNGKCQSRSRQKIRMWRRKPKSRQQVRMHC